MREIHICILIGLVVLLIAMIPGAIQQTEIVKIRERDAELVRIDLEWKINMQAKGMIESAIQ